MLDLRADPVVTLETLMLSAQTERLRSGERTPDVLLTSEQLHDVYSEMQSLVRFQSSPTGRADFTWSGVTLRCEEA